MPRVYVSQATVDRWLSSGRVDLRGDVLRVEAAPAPLSLHVSPAVYFESVDGAGHGADDAASDLIGSVKTSQELAALGAELFDTAVVLGEQAFVVQPGFVAVPLNADGDALRPDRDLWAVIVQQLRALG